MRVPVLSILVALLAATALVVHLQAPLAETTYKDPSGAETSETWTRGALQDEYERRDDNGVPSHIVAGTGLTFMLITLAIMAASALVFAVADLIPVRLAGLVRAGAGVVTAITGTIAFVSNGLLTGRGVADLFESGVLGSDGPPRMYVVPITEQSAIDLVTTYKPISPAIVLGLLFVMLALMAFAWARSVRQERGMRDMATRHGRLAIFGMVALAFVLLTPLVSWELQDNLDPAAGQTVDEDPFLFGAYDIQFYNGITHSQAEANGEAALVTWTGLELVVRLVTLLGAIGVVLAFVGLAGKDLESLDQQVFGRLIENLSMANLLVHAFTIVALVLASFVLLDPVPDISELDATITGLPLIAAPAAVAALIYAGLVAREVIRDDTDLVADDFSEPVIYD